MNGRIVAATVCGLTLIGSIAWARAKGPLRPPEEAFREFLQAEAAEDQLTDPLVLAGPRVQPLVSAAIVDPALPRRRYAIGYLGCAGYKPAAPALRAIVLGESEHDYFRADALQALWQLDRAEGRKLASRYVGRPDHLGAVASGLLGGSWVPSCRTWLDAFFHNHD